MSREMIIAEFQDYARAHQAFCALLQTGIRTANITIITRAKTGCCDFHCDLGILEMDGDRYRNAVRGGRTLLIVEADDLKAVWIERLVGRFDPIEVDTFAAGTCGT